MLAFRPNQAGKGGNARLLNCTCTQFRQKRGYNTTELYYPINICLRSDHTTGLRKQETQVNCGKWRDLASEYVEGTLPPPMREVMANHVKTCPSCQEDEKILHGLYAAMSDLPEVDPPSFFADKVMARIEREQAAGPWWQRMLAGLPNLGRTVFGVGLASAAAVAVVWCINRPVNVNSLLKATLMPDAASLSITGSPLPRLRVIESHDLREGKTYGFRFRIENSDSGNVRVYVPNAAKSVYSFTVNKQETSPVYLPLALARDQKTLALTIDWEANIPNAQSGKQEMAHSRALVVPLPQAANSVDERLTMDLPEMRLADAVRMMAGEYGAAVAMEDIQFSEKVRLTAKNETLVEALQRQLSPLGLKIEFSANGIAIQKATAPSASLSETATSAPARIAPAESKTSEAGSATP